MDTVLINQAEHILASLRRQDSTLVTAESCTGGLLAAYFTAVPGSSDVFERGFVTYSNTAKTELIGVAEALIQQHGAVSEAVACAMALGALKFSPAHVALAITGIAGPAGGSSDKPVGTVHLALASTANAGDKNPALIHHHAVFAGDRQAIRYAACAQAMSMLRTLCA
ncbi:MAG: hypothetical protein RLZZ502_273 [Pseudomonadota bacterium]|jgi:nicotinamide-nucleotide amidase